MSTQNLVGTKKNLILITRKPKPFFDERQKYNPNLPINPDLNMEKQRGSS